MKQIDRKVFRCFIGQCIYTERVQHFTENNYVRNDLPAFLLKHPRYRYQDEVRAVFFPTVSEELKKPIILNCPEAVKYCSFQYFCMPI